jgi:hypothetical protein
MVSKTLSVKIQGAKENTQVTTNNTPLSEQSNDSKYTHDEDGKPVCGRCGAPVARFDHGWYHALTEDFHGYCFWGQPFLYEEDTHATERTDMVATESETPQQPSEPSSTPTSTDTKIEDLREQLAAIEHERWADWQKYCHKVIRQTIQSGGSLEEVLERWDKQINTPYAALSDREQASDMEQVDRYWQLIETLLTSEKNKAVAEAKEARIRQNQSFCGCPFCTHHSEPYERHVKDAQLRSEDE